MAKDKNIVKTTRKASEKQIRKSQTEALQDDAELTLRPQTAGPSKISAASMKRYYRLVDNIAKHSAGREGFINYYKAREFTANMLDVLKTDVWELLDKGFLKEAFDLAAHLFLVAAGVQMDDSDGGLTVIAERCLDIWKEILMKEDAEATRHIFDWCLNHLDGSVIDYMEEHIENFLLGARSFQTPEYLPELLDFTGQKAATEKAKEGDSWSRDYAMGLWAAAHLRLMQQSKQKEKDIDAYAKEYWECPAVRELYIARYETRKEEEALEKLLMECCEIDAQFSGLVWAYRIKLKDLYKRTQRREEYLSLLRELIDETHPEKVLPFFAELKEQFSNEDWPKEREALYQNISHQKLGLFYREEKQLDRLLDFVLKSDGLYETQMYQKDLKDLYPNELLEKYDQELESMAKAPGNRGAYRKLTRQLCSMGEIKGGVEKMEKIINRWRETYANRPAMLDEIEKGTRRIFCKAGAK